MELHKVQFSGRLQKHDINLPRQKLQKCQFHQNKCYPRNISDSLFFIFHHILGDVIGSRLFCKTLPIYFRVAQKNILGQQCGA